MSSLKEKHAEDGLNYLVWFFVLAFAITWLMNLPRLLADNGLAQMPAWTITLNSFATFGPFLAAFILTFMVSRWAGVKGLWVRGWRFNFEKKWLLPVLLLPLLTSGIAVLMIGLTGGQIEWQYAQIRDPITLLIAFVIIYLTQGLPEEYGWRGFALDRLQSRWNAVVASLILGFMWGLWHLPLHFMEGTTQAVIPIHEFILKQMLAAIIYTWIYNNTNGNLFLMILYHTVGNIFGGMIPYWTTGHGRWVYFGVELIIVAIIVVYYGASTLTRGSAQNDAARTAADDEQPPAQ